MYLCTNTHICIDHYAHTITVIIYFYRTKVMVFVNNFLCIFSIFPHFHIFLSFIKVHIHRGPPVAPVETEQISPNVLSAVLI